jgi:hypothetical protein
MKWLIAAAAAALIAVFVYLQLHSVKTSYINGLAPYTKLPGRGFILEQDCYIFKFKARDSDWPLIGSHEAVPELPEKVTAANIGADFPAVRILGVLGVGEHFRIASVRRDESRSGTTITFEIALPDEASRKYPRLDAFWIMDHTPEKNGGAPWILAHFAVPEGKE